MQPTFALQIKLHTGALVDKQIPATQTALDLKEDLAVEYGFQPDFFRIVAHGKMLRDHDVVRQCFPNTNTGQVFVVLRDFR